MASAESTCSFVCWERSMHKLRARCKVGYWMILSSMARRLGVIELTSGALGSMRAQLSGDVRRHFSCRCSSVVDYARLRIPAMSDASAEIIGLI